MPAIRYTLDSIVPELLAGRQRQERLAPIFTTQRKRAKVVNGTAHGQGEIEPHITDRAQVLSG